MTGCCHDSSDVPEKKILRALMVTGGFMAIEVTGGILSGSLALLADAAHMVTDTLSLGLTFLAFRWARRPADHRRSFGYQRAETLAGYTNAVAMVGVILWIVAEAVHRLMAPVPVAGGMMAGVAAAGLVANIIVFRLLSSGRHDHDHTSAQGHHHENLNMRGAILHVAGDLFGSLAALISAGLIIWKGWGWADPVTSLIVAGLVAVSTARLLKDTGHILLEGVPTRLRAEDVRRVVMARIPGVRDVHHIHLWALTGDYILATLHVRADETLRPDAVNEQIKTVLRDELGLSHVTVELEYGACADGAMGCDHA